MNIQQRRWLHLLEAPPLGAFEQQLALWYQQMSYNRRMAQSGSRSREWVTMGQGKLFVLQQKGCHCDFCSCWYAVPGGG